MNGVEAMLIRDHKRMRLAGGILAEAAIRVIHDYDGLHRLSLAVAGWAEAIAAEGDRPHASADTRPEGGDGTEIAAPFTSGAVPEADAQSTADRKTHNTEDKS